MYVHRIALATAACAAALALGATPALAASPKPPPMPLPYSTVKPADGFGFGPTGISFTWGLCRVFLPYDNVLSWPALWDQNILQCSPY